MEETKRTIIVTKIYDNDCDICNHMSKHDRATFESFPEIDYREVNLDDVLKPTNTPNPLSNMILYQHLEQRCLSSTYELDLPVYIFTSKIREYLDHLQGANTVQEIRERVKGYL
jgi:hypothetical protein